MAITPLHFAFITKYVAHFVAESLLFPMIVITRKMRDKDPFHRYGHISLIKTIDFRTQACIHNCCIQ